MKGNEYVRLSYKSTCIITILIYYSLTTVLVRLEINLLFSIMRCRWFILTLLVFYLSVTKADDSAKDVLIDIYHSCVSQFSFTCVRPKAIQWISNCADKDKIKLTDELSIIRTSNEEIEEKRNADNGVQNLFEKVDNFLAKHALKIEPKQILQDETLRSFIPKSYTKGGLVDGIVVPLSEGKSIEGTIIYLKGFIKTIKFYLFIARGFVKKVMIPFLLGLKFKSTVLVPLSLALIALKSWKAMTLGLLSLVLAGAMVIFKFAKPKIVNYEIVHFPHHPHHHVDHHPIIHDAPHWARQIAYHGHEN